MPETIFNRDFSAGWCPSDDEVDGRANALLVMDNLELDRNGALQLIHGTHVVYTGFTGIAHTMFSRFINNTRYDYSALSDGSVYRNSTSIATGGDTTNAAFGTAFNFTLICSGAVKLKDNGTAVVNLGVGPPTVAPTITQNTINAPWAIIDSTIIYAAVTSGDLVVVAGGASNAGGGNYLNLNTNSATSPTYPNQSIIQSHKTTATDLTILGGPAGTGNATDDDFVTLNGYTPNPFGLSIQFDILLVPGDSAGDIVSDYYSYTVADIALQADFNAYTGQFTLRIPRISFNRVGGGAQNWTTTYGFRLTMIGAPVLNINIWGLAYGEPLVIQGGTGAQFGTDYQYMQVNVNNTGSYIARSEAGPSSKVVTINGNTAQVSIQNPTAIDPQVNEVWIYRRGGNLGGTWYRVLVVKSPWTSPVYDNMGDQLALELDITFDFNLISIRDITDKVYDIIGPIQGRWFYFTTNFMYPSDLNDPDLINPSIAVRICGSTSELFMWARSVSASVCIIGTSIDCYLLTGTFSTFPDGTVDIYYQSLGVKFPPITYDAVSYGGSVYYLATDGWRMVLPTSFGTTYSNQNNQLMVAPNTDRLYRGEACYGYLPPTMPTSPGSIRFPITIAKNKIWCFITGTNRGETYDFLRQYWRPYNYGLGDVSACVATQDSKVLVFNKNDKTIREYDYSGSKLVDGSGQQTINVLFTYKDGGKPRQRKDTYTFKTRCYTDGAVSLFITDEKGNVQSFPTTISSPTGNPDITNEIFMDLSQNFGTTYPGARLPKAYQIRLLGKLKDAVIQDWSIDFDSRPLPLTFLRVYPTNFGSASQKRLRTWPIIIDTLGQNVTFTPDVDGQVQTPTIFNTTSKRTVFHYFVTDIFGIDYGATLYDPSGLMEIWDTGTGGGVGPTIVENLPGPVEFDQVGPLEIFRFGKIVRMAVRLFSTGTPIPFKIYLGDTLTYTGQFNVTPGVEDEYIVDLPKGVSGRILRVELGPCGFTFNRYFMKFQVAISGAQKDTELQWITVPGITSALAGGV